jgi:cyclopropane-fatty-acyl-phospholipid synthase
VILALLDRNLIPDPIIRFGIRRLLEERETELMSGGPEAARARRQALQERLWSGPVAEATRDANEQHYEVPTDFFLEVLGPWRKYSSCFYNHPADNLRTAEETMLAKTADGARIQPSNRVLDLGCGWGSFTLFAAQRHPDAQFTAVSNSATQREFIEAQCRILRLSNVEVITADINDFHWQGEPFDRVVSVEMMEHVRNHRELFARLTSWTAPNARMYVHIFVHRQHPYLFEVDPNAPPSPGDWMSRYFFTGGMMPDFHWLPDAAAASGQWVTVHQEKINGMHYSRTLEAWLSKMDGAPDIVRPILAQAYGQDQVTRWWVRWRVFFMACSELFAYRGGDVWHVAHYAFERKG